MSGLESVPAKLCGVVQKKGKGAGVEIRKATLLDMSAIVAIACGVRDSGDSWWWPDGFSEADLVLYWLASDEKQVFVATIDDEASPNPWAPTLGL